MFIVAFSGPKGAGKDTAAKRLLSNSSGGLNWEQVNFATPLKKMCADIFGFTYPQMNDPALKDSLAPGYPYSPRYYMQHAAQMFRDKFGEHVWSDIWKREVAKKLDEGKNIVVTDIRYPDEWTTMKLWRGNAFMLYVNNDAIEVARRKGISRGDPVWNHPSEAYAQYMYPRSDRVIHNNGNIAALHAQVDSFIEDFNIHAR